MKNTRAIHRTVRLALGLATMTVISLPGLAQQPGASSPAPQAAQHSRADIDVGRGDHMWRFESSYTLITAGPWKGHRTRDGQPDVSGSWTNTIGNHANFEDPQGGQIGSPGGSNTPPHPAKPRNERAPSRVTDPADGHVPFQPWAIAKVNEFREHFWNPVAPQYVEPLERCAPNGPLKSLYYYGYEINQYPGYVVFTFETGSRIVPLSDQPHLADNVKLWNGDSRGHWEGNTLVVDIRNVNGKSLFGRSGEFFSENATLQERYTFADDGMRYVYQAVVTDPTVYTRPFTVTIPARRWTNQDEPSEWAFAATVEKRSDGRRILDPKVHECVENNDGFALGSITGQ